MAKWKRVVGRRPSSLMLWKKVFRAAKVWLIYILCIRVCVCIYIMWVFSFSLSTGCILGVGLVLSLMSYSSQTESRVHVSASLRKLCKYLENSEDQSRSVQEVWSVLSQILNLPFSLLAAFNNSTFYRSFIPVVLE